MTNSSVACHWLLNLAVEQPIWLDLLFPIVETQALNVKAIPGFDAEDYAKCLNELLNLGMVKLSTVDPTQSDIHEIIERLMNLPGDLPPTWLRRRIPGIQVSFELTALGGETWERFSEPDWAHIVVERRDATSSELISPDRHKLMAYMGWYPEIHHEKILCETVEWHTQTRFPILYWRRLPFVHHASFKVVSAEARWGVAAPAWFREWQFASTSWHKDPWDLPGWHS